MAKKNAQSGPGVERRARVEEIKKQQKAAERKKTLIFGGIGLVVAIGLIGGPAIALVHKNKDKNRDPDTIGLSEAAAGCEPVQIDIATGNQNHVGAGVHVDYATAPPSSGKHFEIPATVTRGRNFYTEKDRPPIEQLVHNLEHGYTIAWYEPSLPADQISQLKDLATTIGNKNATRKFIVAPWDDTRGKFPNGKLVAVSHWGTSDKGYRRYCGSVSGAAITSFMSAYPATDSPEPNTP